MPVELVEVKTGSNGAVFVEDNVPGAEGRGEGNEAFICSEGRANPLHNWINSTSVLSNLILSTYFPVRQWLHLRTNLSKYIF